MSKAQDEVTAAPSPKLLDINTIDFKNLKVEDFTLHDEGGHNILHYACRELNIDKINATLVAAKNFGVIDKCINHRDKVGMNPLGAAFELRPADLATPVKIATIFAGVQEYDITGYLNNKTLMDYTSYNLPNHNQPWWIGGTTVIHAVMFVASWCTTKDLMPSLKSFFLALNKRLEDIECFNPDYPSMRPAIFVQNYTDDEGKVRNLDGHMVSVSKLLEHLPFKLKAIANLCKLHFSSTLSLYRAIQFEDSSGDSDDGGDATHPAAPASKYKTSLVELDGYIRDGVDGSDKDQTDINFQRTFDRYKYDFSIVPSNVFNLLFNAEGSLDQTKLAVFNQNISGMHSRDLLSKYKVMHDAVDKMVVPLFHGVPFMRSQYTNAERREIFEQVATINSKLLRLEALNNDEQILIGIHSRTATASVGMQSLHDLMTASSDDLQKLEAVDNHLLQYFMPFTRDSYPQNFKVAMKKFIFDFLDSPIKDFWENNNDGVLPPPEAEIVKYRFPVIATGKAIDHPARFALGKSVEGNRGETPMTPEYVDNGYPTHRFAGLIYVTLHQLSDLVKSTKSHTTIDVNRGLKTGDVNPGTGWEVDRFSNQLEYDFMGKMDSSKVIAVIPIIYPHIKCTVAAGYKANYHQAIWGINAAAGKGSVSSPTKLTQELSSPTTANPTNPEFENGVGFTRVMVHTLADLANGILVAHAKIKDLFLCSITENNTLTPYAVKFKTAEDASEAQAALKPSTAPKVANAAQVVQTPMWQICALAQAEFDAHILGIQGVEALGDALAANSV